MKPYDFAITTLEIQAQNSETNAPIHEAEGNHAQGALARMTAASCRAAIAALQAAPAEQAKAYTWADVAGYSQTIAADGLAPDKARWFLTMSDGKTFTVDAGDFSEESQLREFLLGKVNEQAAG